jgi:hypothetical protein
MAPHTPTCWKPQHAELLDPHKINRIDHTNPHWIDLYPTLPGVALVPALFPSRELGPRDKPEDDT